MFRYRFIYYKMILFKWACTKSFNEIIDLKKTEKCRDPGDLDDSNIQII
jgi:hypothetical protein